MWYGPVKEGLGWFCLVTTVKVYGLEVPELVLGGTAQTAPKPLQIRHYAAQPLQKDLGSQDVGTHTFSILLESLSYRSLLLSSL